MNEPASCPPIDEIERFLLGMGDEETSRSYEGHFAACDRCLKAMEGLTARDEIVQALARVHTSGDTHSKLAPEESTDLARLLIPQLKRIAIDRHATAVHPSSASGAADSAAARSTIFQPAGAGVPQRLGHYEIRGILGSGGMGTVLEAYDTRLKRLVAIKVVQKKWTSDPSMLDRFLREAQAAAAVEHDHIVTIHSVELHEGAPCIVMPLLRGKTLAQRISETKGPLPTSETLRIAIETCAGLAAAHTRGLIHRDIKPANLWLEEPSGRLKILDFGLAQHRSEVNCDAGEISGTPGFVSPEQTRGFAVDARSDLFSLGCVLYTLASGKLPFAGSSSLQALWTVLSDPPPAAISVNPKLPPALSVLISELIAHKPDHRPVSAEIVQSRLLEIEQAPLIARQRQLHRRRFMILGGGMVATGAAVGAWAMLTRAPVDPPLAMSLSSDEPGLSIELKRDGASQTVVLDAKVSLPPGEYEVAATNPHQSLVVWPDKLVVNASAPTQVQFTLIGEAAIDRTHTLPVTGVAVDRAEPSSITYSVSFDRTVNRWDSSKPQSNKWAQLPHVAHCLALSPKGDEIAIGGGNKSEPTELGVTRRNAVTLEPIAPMLTGYQRQINAVTYSPDGASLATCGGDGVWIWNLASGEPTLMPQSTTPMPRALTYSADGTLLLTAGDEGSVTFWDIAAKRPSRTHNLGKSALLSAVLLPNGFAVASEDGSIYIWNNVQAAARMLSTGDRPIRAIVAPKHGKRIYSAGDEGVIHIWSVAEGAILHRFTGHPSAVTSLSLAPDERTLISGGVDQSVRRWRLPIFE